MLFKLPWNREVEPKMVILTRLLPHFGALGHYLGSNLVHLVAKLGAKRHRNLESTLEEELFKSLCEHRAKEPAESFPRGWQMTGSAEKCP